MGIIDGCTTWEGTTTDGENKMAYQICGGHEYKIDYKNKIINVDGIWYTFNGAKKEGINPGRFWQARLTEILENLGRDLR